MISNVMDTAPAKPRPKKAVVYARVSSKEQEREGFSIPAQQKLLNAYATREGFVVVREFVDAETAKLAGRTQFNQMLAFMRENLDVRAILVEKTDRLYRNFKDYVTLDELDLEIHLVKEGEILSKDSKSHQKFIHGIKLLMAKSYCDNLSEETRKGMVEKVAQGGYPHFAPVGYRNDPVNHSIVVHKEEASFVRKLFEWYATGEYSLADLRKRCVAVGFKGGRGAAKIAKSKVEWILKNPFYAGQFRWKGELHQGTHESIIPKELFNRVQKVFGSHNRKVGWYGAHEFSFGGLMTCGTCGCSVTAETRKGRYTYYYCTRYHGNCTEGRYREEALAGQFDSIVRGIALDADTVASVKVALRDSLADETAYHREAVETLTARLDQVKVKLNRAYEDKLDGKITEAFWNEKTTQWQGEKAHIMEELARHQGADDHYLDFGVRVLEVARKGYDLYLRQSPGEKRRLLGMLLSNCTMSGGRVTHTYKQPFATVALMTAQATEEKLALVAGGPISEVWGPFLYPASNNPSPPKSR